MNSMINPFKSVGKIVTGNYFVGREAVIDELRSRVLDMPLANAAIVGLPRIGKSSLMNHVFIENADSLWETDRIVTVWYTFKDYSDDSIEGKPEDVFVDIIQRIVSILKKHGFVDDEVNEYARRAAIPGIRFQQLGKEITDFFDEVTITNDIGVIICIDEFDYSKEVFSRAYFQLLRQITDDYPNVAIVTTSRRSILDIEKDSGGGSSFYETCLHIFLKPFSDEEVAIQRSLAGDLSDEEDELLDDAAGNHPYLNALVLLRYFQSHDMEGSIDESYQNILTYYNRLFERVLKRDHLDDKVINIFSGFLDAVSQDEEEYILKKFGLFKAVQNGSSPVSLVTGTDLQQFEYVPFCGSFDAYMRQLYKKNPYKLIWPRAERSIKVIISKSLETKYGNNHSDWINPVKSIVVENFNQKHFEQLMNQMEDELIHYPENGSDNIVDQLYPKDFNYFIKEFWDDSISHVLGHTLLYWTDRIDFLAGKVRNPESHSRLLLDDETKSKATIVCKEIIECAEKAYGHIE